VRIPIVWVRLSMYCPACGLSNGDFTVRCQRCGQELPVRPPVPAPSAVTSWTSLTKVFATTTAIASIIAIGLAAIVIQRGLLATSLALPLADSQTTAASAVDLASPPTGGTKSSWPAMPPPRVLDVGQTATNGDWAFVLDQASFASDPTANGWSRANVVLRFENTGTRTARLDIPAATSGSSTANRSRDAGPSVLPLQAAPAKSSAAVDGLRVVLRDSGSREFGGGFGPDLTAYDLIVAPGDTLRLPFSFRYPSSTVGPFALRLTFPKPANAGSFDVRLDSQPTASAQLPSSSPPPELAIGSWETVNGEWAVSSDGVDFGPGRGIGERPVTLNLKVWNLTDSPRPALIDRDDQTGMSRDFYLIDASGNLAYSHVDSQPSVIVPAHETRDVAVQLFTTDLASTARPLVFTAVLNWHTSCYLRFQIN
jgi:hypothetical protein